MEDRRLAGGEANRLGSRHTEVVGGLATRAMSGVREEVGEEEKWWWWWEEEGR